MGGASGTRFEALKECWEIGGGMSAIVHQTSTDSSAKRGRRVQAGRQRELPDMMSAKYLDFLTPSPLSAFGSDLI